IQNYTPDMSPKEVDHAIERAWKVWSDVTPLTFTRVNGDSADIEISFTSGSHGDCIPFDGPGQQLAHAFSPAYGGNVHFDEDEIWTKDLKGTNLFLVAAHEFGHSLGLHHSDVLGALMFSIYQPVEPQNFKLHRDDTEGIQQLYVILLTDLCDPHLAFDAVTTLRGETLFFKDSLMWRKFPHRKEIERNSISSFWIPLSSGIDAAYEVEEDDTVYLFKGTKYWAVRANLIEPGFPENIDKLGLPQTVKKVDAALYDEKPKKIYFFSGSQYWSRYMCIYKGNSHVYFSSLCQRYLKNYYNFTTDGKSTLKWKVNSPIMKKIKEMQEFIGLEVTGSLDSSTLEAIQKPRCGNPDIGEYAFFSGQPKWGKKDLTYRILNHTPDMKERDVQYAIEKAFKVWSRVSSLTFTPTQHDNADIMISFGSRDHGDFNPFDGPGGTVAHAYAPAAGIGGDAHFDEDENWTHGLEEHGDNSPFDGRDGILAHAFQPGNNIGGDAHFDNDEEWTKQGSRGRNLFLVAAHEFGHSLGLSHSSDPGALMYPTYSYTAPNLFRLPQDDIDGIQAIYGNKYWVLDGYDVQSGYPRSIYELGFPRNVKKIDAAFSDPQTGKTYFFSGFKYWRYDEIRQTMEQGYPRKILKDFKGISRDLDAALQQDGYIYFFKGIQVFQFDPKSQRVVSVKQSNSWLNC
ncbi:hypothetical protein JRQ81_019638, partial [Phrynocephalus forsythii]